MATISILGYIAISLHDVFCWVRNAATSSKRRMMALTQTKTPSYAKDDGKISFLGLPCEIRLHIYHLVHVSSPVHHPKLAPWYAIPHCRTHIVQAVTAKRREGDEEPSVLFYSPLDQQHKQARLLSPHRPLCRIPSALLQSCRQIYGEARSIALHQNEFFFVGWFATGLSSALAFTRGLAPWQRAEVRYLRLEVYAEDLVHDSASFADWVQLMGHLTGLRGVRMTVLNKNGGMAWDFVGTGSGSAGKGAVLVSKKETKVAHELVVERRTWIEKGLGKLAELQQVEVELADSKWTDEEKLGWCARLHDLLADSKSNSAREVKVKVVCVRKLGPGQRVES